MAKLTREAVRSLKAGMMLCVPCADAAELDSNYQTALQVRKEIYTQKKFDCGHIFISRSSKDMQVKVTMGDLITPPKKSNLN